MTKYFAVCDGEIIENSEGVLTCSGTWLSQLASIPFDASQIDPTIATMLFSGGFFLCFAPWITAVGISHLLSMVK